LKKFLHILFFSAIVFITPLYLSAQTDATKIHTDTVKAHDEIIINGKHYKAVDETKASQEIKKKKFAPLDSEFVVNNKRFKFYNNWITVGGGGQQNLTYKRPMGFAGGLDFNFHVKQNYFQLGTIISGERFGLYNNYQFHFGYGKRFEDKDVHFSGFIGVSYSTGYGKVGDSVYTRPFNQPGLYAQAEVIKKVTYDVGVGASLFADWNQEQAIIGARFIIYFSGAYKGKKFEQYQTN
jgi:hypothetical protein